MMEKIARLGQRAHSEWAAREFAYEEFPSLSLELLREFRLHETFSTEEIADWLAGVKVAPRQLTPGGNFGQPPVTLYYDDENRFVIDVYFWLVPDTAVHDHGFSGACTVLEGISLEVEHRFEVESRLKDDFTVGRTRDPKLYLLRKGDCFPIPSGESFVHEVWHLTYPTVSLVLRTINDPGVKQKYYHLPHYAVPNYVLTEQSNSLRRRMFELLTKVSHPFLGAYLERILESSDLCGALEVATLLPLMNLGEARLEEALGALQKRFGAPFEKLVPVLIHRMGLLQLHPSVVIEEEQRLFMGLLATVGFGTTMLEILADYRKEIPPVDQIARCLQGLSVNHAVSPKMTLALYDLLQLAQEGKAPADRGAFLREKHHFTKWEIRIAEHWHFDRIPEIASTRPASSVRRKAA